MRNEFVYSCSIEINGIWDSMNIGQAFLHPPGYENVFPAKS